MSRGLPLNVKLCLDKALDSALLSVETYAEFNLQMQQNSD